MKKIRQAQIFLGLSLFLIANAYATVPKTKTKSLNPSSASQVLDLEENVKEHPTNSWLDDTDLAEGLTYKDLYRDYITADQKWSLLKKIRRGNPDFARKVYLSCIESLDWFLRSGGVQFLASLDPELARVKALKLLKEDPALMVRSAALGVLERLGLDKHKTDLWNALKDAKNFHKGHSLWIRKDLAKNLLKLNDIQDNAQWIRLLNDNDLMVVEYSIKALEKNNGFVMGKANHSVTEKAELWRQKLNIY